MEASPALPTLLFLSLPLLMEFVRQVRESARLASRARQQPPDNAARRELSWNGAFHRKNSKAA
jgi:hypothetical protein